MTRPEPRELWTRARSGPTLGQHHRDRSAPAFSVSETAIEPEPTKPTPVRVLVIEDDPDVADGIERILTTLGFQVHVAFDGRDGLNKALANSYGLIIVDLLLPSMNGFKLCAQIREAESWVPIMVLTAKTGDLDQAESLDAGADDFLTKPFALAVFVAHVRALLRRTSHIQVRRLTVNGLVLDPVRHRCSNSTVEVQLSAREVEVLACLMTNSGRAMSKDELLTRVWGPDFKGDPNIVEVYVGHLRKKLEVPFERRVIETIRGYGYQLHRADDSE